MHDPHQLLPVAYRAAAQVVRSRLLAEEAGERAVHLLALAMIEGSAPMFPKAWLRTVARRSACALLRSEWARTRSLSHDELAHQQAPYQLPRRTRVEQVRERVEHELTPRQQQAFDAAVSCNTTRAAARRCGMQPRDFRRFLGAITRKAREAFASHEFHDHHADDPAVQFRLPS